MEKNSLENLTENYNQFVKEKPEKKDGKTKEKEKKDHRDYFKNRRQKAKEQRNKQQQSLQAHTQVLRFFEILQAQSRQPKS